MDKKSLRLLEQVFEAEIKGALSRGPRLFQTKSKLAKKLVEDGYLEEDEFVFGGRFPVRVRGYVLTHLGRLTYCSSC